MDSNAAEIMDQFPSQQTISSTRNQDLYPDAELAATGDEAALDRLFDALADSAWGTAFSVTDAVGPAADAVTRAFSELLQLFDNGLAVGDVRTELLRLTRSIALNATSDNHAHSWAELSSGAHAREPLNLLGETKDRHATLAFTALSERLRSALWLTEAECFSITKVAQLMSETHRNTEDLVRQARAQFRTYYVDAVKRSGVVDGCAPILDKLAQYVGRSLNAGDLSAVEHHLGDCKECRAIVLKLDDLGGRLNAAIPPVPAGIRQQIGEAWAMYVPAAKKSEKAGPQKRRRRNVALLVGAVVVAALALGVGAAELLGSTNSKPGVRQVAAAPLANSSVGTPKVLTLPTTTSTTEPAPTSTTTEPAPTSTTTEPARKAATGPSVAAVTAPRASTTTTTTNTTTTNAPTPAAPQPASEYTLVNLPPVPIAQ
jgi:DNA-directed RNA polymerase specialized sigma24 family protein